MSSDLQHGDLLMITSKSTRSPLPVWCWQITHLAINVFPVPGGPNNRIPLGGWRLEQQSFSLTLSWGNVLIRRIKLILFNKFHLMTFTIALISVWWMDFRKSTLRMCVYGWRACVRACIYTTHLHSNSSKKLWMSQRKFHHLKDREHQASQITAIL